MEPQLAALIEEGKLRFAYHHRVLRPDSQLPAEAAECAADQGKFWEMHGTLLSNQVGGFGDIKIKDFARSLGLDTAAFNQCLDSGKYTRQVTDETARAQSAGINSTPTFMLNGKVVTNYGSFDELVALVKEAVNKQ